jgi:hypothetical protein
MQDLWLSLVLIIALWAELPATAELWAGKFPDRIPAVTFAFEVMRPDNNHTLRFEMKFGNEMKRVE